MPNDIPISERELEILRLVATGASNQQIAQQLSISINTVKVHLRNIFSKIDVVSRTEATVYAINNGLIATEPGPSQAFITQRSADELDGGDLLNDQADILVAEEADPLIIAPADVVPMPRPASPPAWKSLIGAGAIIVLVIIVALGVTIARSQIAPQSAITAPAATTPAVSAPTNDLSQRWFSYAPLPNPRDGFAMTAYDQESKLYVIGGRVGGVASAAIDRFDPTSNLWVSLSDKPTAVSDAGAISLRGSIYIPGGIDSDGNVRDILDIYDPREQRWSEGPKMPAPRSRYALIVWEGSLYVIGGWDGAQPRSEVYIYDPQNNTWAEGPHLASPRQSAGAAVASGRIYVIGGSDAAGPLRASVRLDPTSEDTRWETIAPLPEPVTSPGVIAPFGTLLVFDLVRHQGLQYEQGTDSWTSFTIPDNATIASSVVLLGRSIYFVSDTASPNPGGVGEYRMIFTLFVPGTGGILPAP